MKNTTEITMRGEPTNLESLLGRVESRLHGGWKRDRRAEERFGRHGVRGPWDYCFSCTAGGLWIHARGPNELYISGVVALEKQKLTEEESNRLLVDFEREFLRPAAAEVGVTTAVVQRRLNLEHDLSPEAIRHLQAFSASANRSGLDADDRERWDAFLVRVHQDDSRFDPALLDEWLRHEGWPENARSQLIEEHERARSLLSAYDAEAEKR